MRKNRGFTLVELLVVVAIIGILAAIMFPTFAKAREAARRATCVANIHSIALACLMYAEEYDSVLPVAASDAGSTTHLLAGMIGPHNGFFNRDDVWVGATNPATNRPVVSSDFQQLGDVLLPYLRNLKMLDCPTVSAKMPWYKLNWHLDHGAPKIGYYGTVGDGDALGHSGGYRYACFHTPYWISVGDRDATYNVVWIWGVIYQNVISPFHYVADKQDPAARWACGSPLSMYDDPSTKTLVECLMPGLHGGWEWIYAWKHGMACYSYGTNPIPFQVVGAFVDGHAKYYTPTYWEYALNLAQQNSQSFYVGY